ncbi:protein takeout-like [Daktulosphaira vitifoliae]|uniref:protein takeout-like n=1 Tax=Daktulosphaira vitifoliae TaxID=58002 RepID=UPI0021AA1BD4|nr:protein takeout-like [Daktulosphaira vitifoliae]
MALIGDVTTLLCLMFIIQMIKSTNQARSTQLIQLPDGFITCKRSDPLVNKCIQKALQSGVPRVLKGYPNLDVVPIDPLYITEMDIEQTKGPFVFKLSLKDMNIFNFGSVKILSIKSDIDKYLFNLNVEFSQPLILDSNYKINGKAIILPINGEGKSNLTLEDVKASIDVKGRPVAKNGQNHMDLEILDIKFTSNRLYINFENLFNGDKYMGNNMNKYLNKNWKMILNQVQPSFEVTLGNKLQSIAQAFFTKVPYNTLFK